MGNDKHSKRHLFGRHRHKIEAADNQTETKETEPDETTVAVQAKDLTVTGEGMRATGTEPVLDDHGKLFLPFGPGGFAPDDKPEAPSDPALLFAMRRIVKCFNLETENALMVVHGVDFAVKKGEFVSVVGASGSGKSTLMNIIGLLDKPNAGRYFFNGEDMLSLKDDKLAHYRSKNIGFVFQNFNLIGRISAVRNVEMPMLYAGMSGKERTERAEHLLEIVGMADRMKHNPNELSGGQKQRVAIARSLANDPGLILADEPTGALDSVTGRMVMDIFHDLNENQGKTIVLITHNPELAAETARVVTMVDGRITSNKSKTGTLIGTRPPKGTPLGDYKGSRTETSHVRKNAEQQDKETITVPDPAAETGATKSPDASTTEQHNDDETTGGASTK